MKKKVGIIASAVATTAICASMIAGSTYALFQSNSEVDITVTAGNVSITAKVVEGESYSTLGGDALGNFSTANGVALENIVPGDVYNFTVKAENASTVSTLYRTTIKIADTELAPALVVSIAGVEYEGLLEYTGAWAELAAKADPADLAIQVAFPDSEEDQNYLQNKSTTISVIVEGVQANAGYEVGGAPTVVLAEKVDMALFNATFNYALSDEACVISGLAEDTENTSELYVPAKVNGKPVTIAERAFKDNKGLEKVTLNCAVIDAYAFQGCENLSEVVLGEGVEEINYRAFACEQDERWYADGESNKIQTVVLPDSLTKLSSEAFYGCKYLEEVIFGENSQLTEVGNNAFQYCENLVSINLPATVKTIGEGAFIGCESLEYINLPATLEDVGGYYGNAFGGCSKLTTINFVGTQEECEAVWAMIEEVAEKDTSVTEYLFGYGYYTVSVEVHYNGEYVRTLVRAE